MAIAKLMERTRQTCLKVLRRLSHLPKTMRGNKNNSGTRRNNRVSPIITSLQPQTRSAPNYYYYNHQPETIFLTASECSLPFEEQLLRMERRRHHPESSVSRYMSALTSTDPAGLDLVNPGFEWGPPHECSTPIPVTTEAHHEGLDNSLNEALERTGAVC